VELSKHLVGDTLLQLFACRVGGGNEEGFCPNQTPLPDVHVLLDEVGIELPAAKLNEVSDRDGGALVVVGVVGGRAPAVAVPHVVLPIAQALRAVDHARILGQNQRVVERLHVFNAKAFGVG